MKNHQAWLSPIRLAARRGNLEAELLLDAYIDKVLRQQNNPELISQFSQLLEQDDQTLFDWLMHPDSSPPRFQPLITDIRKTYLTP